MHIYCISIIIGKPRIKRVNKCDNLFFHFSLLNIEVNKKIINSTMVQWLRRRCHILIFYLCTRCTIAYYRIKSKSRMFLCDSVLRV